MAKNTEEKMIEKLTPLLNKGEELEYVLYGEIAPSTKKIAFTAVIIIIAVLGVFNFLNIHWAWQTVVMLVVILIAIELFYKDVYIGKFGKRLFLCELNALGKEQMKEEVPIKCVDYIDNRSDDTHITIQLNFDGQKDFIVIRQKPRKKGLIRQSVNITLLEEDIFKKQRKK